MNPRVIFKEILAELGLKKRQVAQMVPCHPTLVTFYTRRSTRADLNKATVSAQRIAEVLLGFGADRRRVDEWLLAIGAAPTSPELLLRRGEPILPRLEPALRTMVQQLIQMPRPQQRMVARQLREEMGRRRTAAAASCAGREEVAPLLLLHAGSRG